MTFGESLFLAIVTAFVGVTAYVSQQALIRLVVEPILTLRGLVAEAVETIGYYSDYLHNPTVTSKEKGAEITSALRRLAFRIEGTAATIPMYERLSRRRWVPPWGSLMAAKRALVGLSNSTSLPLADHRVYDAIHVWFDEVHAAAESIGRRKTR